MSEDKEHYRHQDYDAALRVLGWTRLDEVPELHDAVAPAAAVVHYVKRERAGRTFGDMNDAAVACETGTICGQCYVIADLSIPVTPDSPDHHQPPNHTGWWIVDLGPFSEKVEPTVYRATRAIDPAAVPDGGKATWTVLQASANNEKPGESYMTLLAAMKIERTVYPWGCRRVWAKRFPKDTGGRWVYRAPGAVTVKADFHGVPTQAIPSIEVTTVQFGPEPEKDDGALLGEQGTLRRGNIKLDYLKALGEGRQAIIEITDKSCELAALARSALVDPKTATDFVTALSDDRYDPPLPGKTQTQAVIMAICDEHGDTLDLLTQLTY